MTRKLNPDRHYTAPAGGTLWLAGRSLMLIRNVGHHMYTDAVLDAAAREIPEGSWTRRSPSLIALHDLTQQGADHEQPRGLGLYSEAEDARAGRGGADRRPVRRVEAILGLAREHPEDGHHGRGTAHLRQPQGVHRGGGASGWCSSTLASSTAPATRSTPRSRPAR